MIHSHWEKIECVAVHFSINVRVELDSFRHIKNDSTPNGLKLIPGKLH